MRVLLQELPWLCISLWLPLLLPPLWGPPLGSPLHKEPTTLRPETLNLVLRFGLGFGVQAPGFRVQDLGFNVWGLGLGFKFEVYRV